MADTKSWLPKALIGCGCLTGIVIIGLAVAGYFGFFAAKDFVEANADGFDSTSILEKAEDLANAAGEKGGAVGKVADAVTVEEENKVSPARLREALQQPLTREDFEQTQAIFAKLKSSDAYKQWESSTQAMKELGDKKEQTTADKLAAMRDMTKGMAAFKDIQLEHDRLVKEAGGYEAHLARLVRLGGMAAAAKQTAKDKKLDDPASDAVAKAIPGEVAAVKKEFLKTEAEAKALREAGKAQEAQMMMMTLLRPGAIAMARMPQESFETWKSFSVEERKKAMDPRHGMDAQVPALLFLAATPEALVVASETDLWK